MWPHAARHACLPPPLTLVDVHALRLGEEVNLDGAHQQTSHLVSTCLGIWVVLMLNPSLQAGGKFAGNRSCDSSAHVSTARRKCHHCPAALLAWSVLPHHLRYSGTPPVGVQLEVKARMS